MSRSPAIAFIPARGGSKRIPAKNIRPLQGHPLLAYSISSALESGLFGRVIVSTESVEIAEIACRYGAEVPFLRPIEYAQDSSPDIDWARFTVRRLLDDGERFSLFAILRPTSPLRTAVTIRRAMKAFHDVDGADSLRAVQKCSEHPGKMWILRPPFMEPLMEPSWAGPGVPMHSRPYQQLSPVFVQNASLELARVECVTLDGTISGKHVVPFITEGFEGFDLNDPLDWDLLETLLAKGRVELRPPMDPRATSEEARP